MATLAPARVTEEMVAALRGRMRGPVLAPGAPGYDETRQIWNGMIDKRPGLIARCTGAADVVAAVSFAREHQLLVSVRGGGHNIAGLALCDDGLMIDLSLMKGIHVDPITRTARVQPGTNWGDLDRETQLFGLAAPGGIVSDTGVAGLTLGGGFGWLSRKVGLTVDSLRSVEIVTADGTLRRASTDENPDLFWAVRGGGGNFGIVTSFEFDLYPLGPTVMAGMVLYPLDEAPRVLDFFRDFSRNAPEEVGMLAFMRMAPPAPFLPTAIHGKPVVGIAAMYNGRVDEGERVLRPIKEFGAPLADLIVPKPYVVYQTSFDAGVPKGRHYYWKTEYFSTLGRDTTDTLIGYGGQLSSPMSALMIFRLGGAIQRVAETATAASHRDAEYIVNIQSSWVNPQESPTHVAWTQEVWQAIRPGGMGSTYINFLGSTDGHDQVRAAYGANYARLQAVKAQVDPDNFFRVNQNIRPTP